MLERATACLDTGARLSLRCARRAPRSKRLLHSTFWNHGAGDVDPALLAVVPPLPLQEVPTGPHGSSQQAQAAGVSNGGGTVADAGSESPFLDFLYPPQALAMIQHGNSERWELWEGRNARRLPKGFVQAKRGYSSNSRRKAGFTEEVENLDEDSRSNEKRGYKKPAPENRDLGEREYWSNDLAEGSTEEATDEPTPEANTLDWHDGRDEQEHQELTDLAAAESSADCPDELAEPPEHAEQQSISVPQLRTAMTTSRRNIALSDPTKSMDFTRSVWSMFERLSPEDKENTEVKIELLQWLSTNDNEVAETHCLELYSSIDPNDRTTSTYKSALSVFLRCNLYGLAEQGHREALSRLRDGPELSAWLCKFTIQRQMWDMASRIKQQLDSMHDGFVQSVNDSAFWREIANIPDLLTSAVALAKHYRTLKRTNSLTPESTAFCTRFFKDAIVSDFGTENVKNSEVTRKSRKPLQTGMIRYLLAQIQLTNPFSPNIFRDVLMGILGPDSTVWYPDAHHTVSYMYYQYIRMSGIKPDEELLNALLERVVQHQAALQDLQARPNSISIETVAKHWESFHGNLTVDAYGRILTFYGRRGNDNKVRAYFQDLTSAFTDWEDQKYGASVLIYVYARRADTAMAKAAFEEVQSLAQKSGQVPEVRCWNALIHAYARAEDPEGAVETLMRLVDAPNLTPDERSFHPILELYAARGDAEAVENLLGQFDNLSERPRSTALYGSLLNAHIKAGYIEKANSVLRDLIPRVRKRTVLGSLTECFNILMTGYALRRETDQIMRTYRWMKAEKIRLDANTYGSLILGLSLQRSINHARQILKSVMPAHGVTPTAFHYSLIFAGYVRQRMFKEAVDLHSIMVRKNLVRSLSSNVTYLRAKAMLEGKVPSSGGKPAAVELREMLDSDPRAGIAVKQPQTIDWAAYGSPDAAHFGHFVFVHGNEESFEAAQALVEDYKKEVAAGNAVAHQAPIRLLEVLINAYRDRQEWAKTDECWKLAKEWSDVLISIGRPVPDLQSPNPAETDPEILDLLSPTETSKAGSQQQARKQALAKRVKSAAVREQILALTPSEIFTYQIEAAPKLRFLLTHVLRSYIIALSRQARYTEMISTVARVIGKGYALDNRAWNAFIEKLLQPYPPLALLAFRLVERFLILDFPGWKEQTQFPAPRSAVAQGLQYIRTKYLRPDQLLPQYRTIVKLGAALLDLRRAEAVGFGQRPAGGADDGRPAVEDQTLRKYVGTTRAIRQLAPKTLHAVQTMPSIQDKWQTKLLRIDR